MAGRTGKHTATRRQRSIQNAQGRIILWVGAFTASVIVLFASTKTIDSDIIYVMIGAFAVLVISVAGLLIDFTRSSDLFGRKFLPVKSKEMARASSRERLMAAFGFDAHELEANRQGYMTNSQRQKLYGIRWRRVWLYGPAALIWLALCIGELVDAVQKGNISLAGAVLGAFVLGAILIMLILAIADRQRRIKVDLYGNDFETVSGNVEVIPAQTELPRRGYTSLPRLKIGTKEFETPVLPKDVFVDGDIYRVFYMPQSMSILTIEHLGGSQEASKHNKAQHKHS